MMKEESLSTLQLNYDEYIGSIVTLPSIKKGEKE
jgi:hypothetical protein